MNDPVSTFADDGIAKLRTTIEAFPAAGFAVLDGAQFADLPASLRREGLFARSLFLDHADAEVEKAGPWLVGLDQKSDALDRIFAFVGDRPAVVYWCCEVSELVLHRHLRTLNIARIPSWAADERPPPAEPAVNEPSASVTFRHWDPRVLGAFLPVLDAAQFARILGPAREIAFLSPEFGGVRRVVRDAAWPPARPGLLTVDAAQMLALSERRVEARRRSVGDYLRDTADGALDGASEADVRAHVLASEARARELGIVTEAGHCRWAFLMMITRGEIGAHPAVADFIRYGAHPPDRQVEDIMGATSRAVRGASARPAGGRP